MFSREYVIGIFLSIDNLHNPAYLYVLICTMFALLSEFQFEKSYQL